MITLKDAAARLFGSNDPAPKRKERDWRYYLPNGKKECARRRKQIAAGILTEANGLVRRANPPD